MMCSNPKLIALEHYDSLIRQVDIHTEELLEKFKDNKHLELNPHILASDTKELNCLIEPYQIRLRIFEESYGVNSYHDPYSDIYQYSNQPADEIDVSPISVGIRDYVNRKRDEMLSELKRIQADTLTRCDAIRAEFASIDRNAPDRIEKLKSKIFAQKFALILQLNEIMVSTNSSKDFIINSSPFKLYLFILDFYVDDETQNFLK